MRTLLIFLSIGLFLTLIHYSAARKPDSWESAEDDHVEMKDKINSESNDDSNDESDEIDMKEKFYADRFNVDDQGREGKNQDIEDVELEQNPEESNSHSFEHNQKDYSKILQDSDED
ncbi:unnamed protein product [Rotaria sp. Silwood1]|nr:unnamed protein product [Rotaria sp. Silwood1]CAF3366776.1 unnamed protein product [Rotaria sp. Silwood1]CAF3399589.1 unnamed protein product [Rotaria sp. Silwood1]CAF4869323.1 unnamed protein product [Rotaria sp. Silwood1]